MTISREKELQHIDYVSEEELDSYRYYHPYMYQRKLDNKTIERFDIGYDRNTNCITFPVRDISGKCLFVARRSVNTKQFNFPEGTTKPLYGIYELYQLSEFPQEIYITESMLDCTNLWRCGKYAVALNGTGTDLQYKQLNMLPCRSYIIATDNDTAGEKARERLKKCLRGKLLNTIIYPTGRKDINECSDEEIQNLQIIFA